MCQAANLSRNHVRRDGLHLLRIDTFCPTEHAHKPRERGKTRDLHMLSRRGVLPGIHREPQGVGMLDTKCCLQRAHPHASVVVMG